MISMSDTFQDYEANAYTSEEAKAVISAVNRDASRHREFLSFLGLTEMAYQYATRTSQQVKTLILALELIDGVPSTQTVMNIMEALERDIIGAVAIPMGWSLENQ